MSMIATWTFGTAVPVAPLRERWCSGRRNVVVGLIPVWPKTR